MDTAGDFSGIFEERAENLSATELQEWTAPTKSDPHILGKLTGQGAKLLTGPRGCGKSTYLRRAYFDLLATRAALPVYVNYSRSLALEPLFHRAPNATEVFRQWVLLKVVVGLKSTFNEADQTLPLELTELLPYAEEIVRDLESSTHLDTLQRRITTGHLVDLLEQCAAAFKSRRVVLLLDDAAHAFSQPQQHAFFEIFRALRTRRVSPKAAVYPGITSYSPFFNVGHEAELVEAWIRVEDPDYLPTMKSVLHTRLPQDLRSIVFDKDDLVQLLAFAAFGIPRGLLNMVSSVLGIDQADQAHIPTRQRSMDAIGEYRQATTSVFEALGGKLPRYRKFIKVGLELVSEALGALGEYNRDRDSLRKADTLALPQDMPAELEKVTQFLEYAGILRKERTVSRGVKGVFQRFTVHHAFVIDANALSLGRAFAVEQIVAALQSRDPHAFVRRTPENLLGTNWRAECQLDLPACDHCGSPRISEEQRYCISCGKELADASVFVDLLRAPIERLPLTPKRVASIKEHTSLRTVQDILADDEGQLHGVPRIGPIWHARIRNYAAEFVSV